MIWARSYESRWPPSVRWKDSPDQNSWIFDDVQKARCFACISAGVNIGREGGVRRASVFVASPSLSHRGRGRWLTAACVISCAMMDSMT